MTPTTLILRYSAFAVIATLINLGSQRIVLMFGSSTLHFAAAVIVGTGTGLVVKYILDKTWIFFDTEVGIEAHGRKFTLYTVMGLVTTAIFWSMESAAWFMWRTEAAREIGAVIGLAIGYVVKYHLDRRFVFTDARLKAAS
ncbi:GtrA-like protein [Ensifer adhaerens]|nr:GtrA-like protein [Ensifer adhaerens]